MKKKIIYAAPQSQPDYLISDECLVKNINWISPQYLNKKNLFAKFRYRQPDIPIKIINKDNEIYVSYPQGLTAITPGQQCVIYYKDICIGGGVIDKIYKKGKKIDYL
jgi:tRNA-specific 2-thiouridylase